MPQEGYLPTAKLREVITYPSGIPDVTDEALKAALLQVGLDRYVGQLDKVERWDRVLDKEEEAALQVANAVLRKPDWLVMDDVLEGLEPEVRVQLIGVLEGLEGTTLIYVGRSEDFANRFKPKIYHVAPLHPNGGNGNVLDSAPNDGETA